MSNVTLSVIVPAYNEARRIGPTLLELHEHLTSMDVSYEIIVVDDGSRDATRDIVRDLRLPDLKLIENGRNRGKGYAVRNGLRAAGGEYAIFTDADNSAAPDQIELFLKKISEGYDMVIATRYTQSMELSSDRSRWRGLMGHTFRRIVRLLFRLPFTDTQCGFKMLNRRAVELALRTCREDGFIFDVELLYNAAKEKLSVCEQLLRWSHKEGSTIKTFNGPIKMALDLMRLRLRTALS